MPWLQLKAQDFVHVNNQALQTSSNCTVLQHEGHHILPHLLITSMQTRIHAGAGNIFMMSALQPAGYWSSSGFGQKTSRRDLVLCQSSPCETGTLVAASSLSALPDA